MPKKKFNDGSDVPQDTAKNGAALVNGENKFTSSTSEAELRRRYRRRNTASLWMFQEHLDEINLAKEADPKHYLYAVPGVSKCGNSISSLVGIYYRQGASFFGSVNKCKSLSTCPVCSIPIRANRSKSMGLLLERALSTAGSMFGLFITVTIRHNVSHSLDDSLKVLKQSWQKLQQSRGYKTLMTRYDFVGFLRTTEVTVSLPGNWHPHFHSCFLFRREMSSLELAAFDAELSHLWQSTVQKVAPDASHLPSLDHGCFVLRCTSGGVANYLAKLQESIVTKRLEMELTRGDLKQSRDGAHLLPFDLLDDVNNREYRRLFCEYSTVMKGHKIFGTSHKLREKLGFDDEELSDAQALEAEEPDDDMEFLLSVITSEEYEYAKSSGLLADLLLAAEALVQESELTGRVSERSTKSPALFISSSVTDIA